MLLELTQDEKARLRRLAHSTEGIPYKYGVEVPDLSVGADKIQAIDCSELIQYLFYKIGYKVRDGSYNQYEDSGEISEADLDVGDLIFKEKNGRINHVAMFIDQESCLIVEAEGFIGEVIIRPFVEFRHVKSPNASQYAGARRLLREKVTVFPLVSSPA